MVERRLRKERRFVQCDVFSKNPLKGNALAVVVDGEGLSEQDMQRFARWTNLAETTFLMQPDDPRADYKVRIFTPAREMPFAGHPTLGSCIAWLRSGGLPRDSKRVRQQCAIGLISIDLSRGSPAFAAPPTQVFPLEPFECQRISGRLSLRPDQIVSAITLNNGPVWQVFELSSAEDVLNVDCGRVAWPEFQAIGLLGKWKGKSDAHYEVRMLAPSSGMSEDPITGSLIAAIAKWLHSTSQLDEMTIVHQGRSVQREGVVSISTGKDGEIWIGGDVNIVIEGRVVI